MIQSILPASMKSYTLKRLIEDNKFQHFLFSFKKFFSEIGKIFLRETGNFPKTGNCIGNSDIAKIAIFGKKIVGYSRFGKRENFSRQP